MLYTHFTGLLLSVDDDAFAEYSDSYEQLLKDPSRIPRLQELLASFGQVVVECQVDLTEDQIVATFDAWLMTLLVAKPWLPNTQSFYLQVDDITAELLPKSISIFDPSSAEVPLWSLLRRFDRFLLSDQAPTSLIADFYDRQAASFEQMADMELKSKLTSLALQQLGERGRAGVVLDVGSGTGLAKRLDGDATIVGIDASFEMCKLASENDEPTAQAYAEYVPFAAQSFSGILVLFVEHYIREKERVFSSLYSLLEDGGVLVFNLHKPPQNWQDDYQQLLESSGFAATDIRTQTQLLQRETGDRYTAHIVIASKHL